MNRLSTQKFGQSRVGYFGISTRTAKPPIRLGGSDPFDVFNNAIKKRVPSRYFCPITWNETPIRRRPVLY